ncbi:trihelix transcription factor ASR3 isoform X2 [Rhodamnia argentea]|uniref:Trihelix transcription factor ASR3 isoform X2 n=1 Tax=Rhodamnia argentea TaxID=178133 RepID=A0ABM3HB89_9MYRT|nr:trihelix transcription factor ASR3 isoform X2 [Rhodamnia argentea]
MKQEMGSGSRRTRSQAAPDWSAGDLLILVNEIAAVEGDCLNALSSYQKWEIISENCTALDVDRTANQCRRKWESLLADYRRIKQHESRSGINSYWSLGHDRRNGFGLPETFDRELFEVINNILMVQEDRADTEPDSDSEAEGGTPEAVASKSGSKRKRKKSGHIIVQGLPTTSPLKDESTRFGVPKSMSPKIVVQGLPTTSPLKNNTMALQITSPSKDNTMELDVPGKCSDNILEKRPQMWCADADVPHVENREEKKLEESCFDDVGKTSEDEQEQAMALTLRENAELIQRIVDESPAPDPGCGYVDVKSDENCKTEFIRGQGDKLIACLGTIMDTLSQLCNVVQVKERD